MADEPMKTIVFRLLATPAAGGGDFEVVNVGSPIADDARAFLHESLDRLIDRLSPKQALPTGPDILTE